MAYVDEALGTNEQIILTVRRHPLVLLWPLIYNTIVLAIIIYASISLSANEPRLFQPIIATAVFPMCLFGFSYLTWINEEYYVTNRRVIQCDGILSKRMFDSSLEKVNDVVLEQSWIGRIFNYGDVQILTASEVGMNMLKMIHYPVRFKQTMLNQKEHLSEDEGYRMSAKQESGIPELLLSLEKLRKEGVLTDGEFQEKKRQLLQKM